MSISANLAEKLSVLIYFELIVSTLIATVSRPVTICVFSPLSSSVVYSTSTSLSVSLFPPAE